MGLSKNSRTLQVVLYINLRPYINLYLHFSRPLHAETPSYYTPSCLSFSYTLGPHDRSLNIFFVLRLLYGSNEASKTPFLMVLSAKVLIFKLVLRLQTKRDRLNLASGLIERKVYIYRNLSYRKDLLVQPPSISN